MKSISLQYFVSEKLYKTEEKGNFGDEISPIIVQNLIGSEQKTLCALNKVSRKHHLL